jgi:HEAT repeat protein
MELDEIKSFLDNSDFQYRLRALTALKDYDAEVAVPLLINKLHDPEFLVRSFVARGLGWKRNADSFAALLEILKFDRDTNVKAEAANSLSLFGQVAIPHLISTFYQNDNWLIRRSILAVLVDMDCPSELLEVCLLALRDEDASVQEAAVEALGTLAGSSQHAVALRQLLQLIDTEPPRIRIKIAYALKQFDDPEAKNALLQLRQDEDHQVIAAALEDLL